MGYTNCYRTPKRLTARQFNEYGPTGTYCCLDAARGWCVFGAKHNHHRIDRGIILNALRWRIRDNLTKAR